MDVPREVVLEFLADDYNLKKIVPNLVDAGLVDEKHEAIGTAFCVSTMRMAAR
jgi:hypothetical protein